MSAAIAPEGATSTGDIDDTYPLAGLQPGLLVNQLRSTNRGVDVHQVVGEFDEVLDADALRAAWAIVAARHDILRTSFHWEGVAVPEQRVHLSARPEVAVLDWAEHTEAEQSARNRAFMAADRARAFDLRVAPMFRVTAIRLGAAQWKMVWTFHHIILDGRSLLTVLLEVFSTYDALRTGNQAPPLPTPRPYREFADWYTAQDFSSHEPFWREFLQGVRNATPLPSGYHDEREDAPVGRGFCERKLSEATTASLTQMVEAAGLSMNIVVQGAWALLLSLHSGERDVVFGATRAGRKGTVERPNDVLGLFINTVPMRVVVEPTWTVARWLTRVRETWRSLFAAEKTPLHLVQRWSEAGRNQLFENQIVFETLTLEEQLHEASPSMRGRRFEQFGNTSFPLTGNFFGGRELTLQIENSRAVIDDATAHRLLDQLATLITGMANPDALVGELTALTDAERARVVSEWNATSAEFPSDATLVSLMSAQVARTPHAIAVVDERSALTFAELDVRTTQLARRLRALGAGADVLVGVCADRSVAMVVALVAVVKAGAAYVPIDPTYPRDRVAFMLEDAGARVLLTDSTLASTLPPHDATVVLLDDRALWQENPDQELPELSPPAPQHTAYMIYTSGSTGKPKGALNAHAGIVNRLLWMQSEYELTPRDVVLQKTPFSFDVSVWEFFWPLITGAKLVMARPDGHKDTAYLTEVIESQGVTVCHFVPSMMRAFLTDPDSRRCRTLRDVMASGEALPADLVAAFYAALPNSRLHNLYGPTECAVDVTYWECPKDATPTSVIPIGRPVANTQVYVLDERGAPCAIGVPGELFLAGIQVGLGYHNRAELTSERFVHDPFAGGAARMYRTGDRARWRPDGTVEYLGRLDFQVKIRGFRIELGEIETALLAHPSVHEAVVIAAGAGDAQKLVAYVVAQGTAPALAALREHLAARLPDYMVPAAFVWLPALPLSSNGKIDRRSLPAPEFEREQLSRAFVAPRTAEELVLADVWREVLQVTQVGVDDNFYELGGDSLLGIQIVARTASRGFRISLTQLLRHATISTVAALAEPMVANRQQKRQTEVPGAVPLTPVQQWFFASQATPDGTLHEKLPLHHWNQALLLTVSADVRADTLRRALVEVARHHDSLRLRFSFQQDAWTQELISKDSASERLAALSLSDFGAVAPAERQGAIDAECARVQASLNIETGPLLHASLMHCGQDEPTRLLIVVHHLAVDGVSWRILREDVEMAYLRLAREESADLPPVITPFSDWARQLVAPEVSASMHADRSFWSQMERPGSVRLPRDTNASAPDLVESAGTLVRGLTADETRTLFQAVPAAYNTQINDVLLSALAEAIGRWVPPDNATSDELVVNVEGHGREDLIDAADVSRTTGWFTTIFPLRLPLRAESVGARLKRTKELVRSVPRRGASYGILRYLAATGLDDASPAGNSMPELVFNYMGQFDQVVAGSSMFGFSTESTGPWFGAGTRRPHLLELNVFVVNGRLEMRWTFSRTAHLGETIAHVAECYVAALQSVIAHCTTPGIGGFTPSDFSLVALDQQTVDALTPKGREVEDIYPVTPLQELFLGAAGAVDDAGFEQWRYRIAGPLHVNALREAWEFVVARHAILRTSFATEGVRAPLQVVHRAAALPWAMHDWRHLSADDYAAALNALLSADRAAGFRIDQAPLMRITLIQCAAEEYELVWSNHHLLLDRWSWPLVLLDVERAYSARVAGQVPALESAPRYADFIAWQLRQSKEAASAFWKRHFAEFTPPARLPMVDSTVVEREPIEVRATLSEAETRALQQFARARQVAWPTVVQGAWALCLARFTQHRDVAFGVAVAGRDAAVPRIERMVGLTLNNLPLRVRIDESAPLERWLRELHATQNEMQQFAHVSLAAIQQWCGIPWRSRLFETLLVFQHDNANERTERWLGEGITTTPKHVPTHTAYPLSVMIAGQQHAEFRITYDARYFREATAQSLADALRDTLIAMTAAPAAALAEIVSGLPAWSDEYLEQNATATPYVAPVSAVEKVIAGIWAEVLGVERIGIHDNFFQLGGYSLVATQIVARLRSTLKSDAPVRLLFQHPTVAELAQVLGARDRKPGQLERIAQLVLRVQNMSLDEMRQATAAHSTTN